MIIRPSLAAAIAAGAVGVLAVSVAGCASAQPPGFPDLSGLTDVTSQHPLNNPRGQPGFIFAIPDGYGCSGGGDSVSCDGRMPGLAGIPFTPMQGPCELGYAEAGNDRSFVQHRRGECTGPANGNVLHPGQKVSMGSVTCGVLPGSVTACSNGTHGFVIQPSGSSSF